MVHQLPLADAFGLRERDRIRQLVPAEREKRNFKTWNFALPTFETTLGGPTRVYGTTPFMSEPQPRRPTYGLLLAGAAAVGLVIAATAWAVVRTRSATDVTVAADATWSAIEEVDDETSARVVAFCGDCHGVPDPANYARSAWRKEVVRGYEFYARSGRVDLDPPPLDRTIAYFQSRAAEMPSYPAPLEAETPLAVRFRVEKLPASNHAHFPPAITDLRWTRLNGDDRSSLLACDMRQGTVTAVDFGTGRPTTRLLGRLHHPCHVEPCDLDGDGERDLVVADMGGLAAVDFDLGRVVWLRRQGDSFEEISVAEGLGRVSDVRPADFDGDGDLDLIVGEFGARRGRILLLRNQGGETPDFEVEEIDRRPGAIHLPVYDLNDDGFPDFVALVSQEFESVDAFLNLGNGRFRRRVLWEAGDPAFGSSGIQLVDIDQDRDIDILCTNGDSFDDKYVKPCHGVQWLENLGGLRFQYHRLADLPGAYHALAGDVDGDGDSDIMATVWVEPKVKFGNPGVKQWASLVCLEQVAGGQFVRHTLEKDFPWHATLELADFDADGDLDVALGSHSRTPTLQLPYWLAVWWNE